MRTYTKEEIDVYRKRNPETVKFNPAWSMKEFMTPKPEKAKEKGKKPHLKK